jgi:hypothetical protein
MKECKDMKEGKNIEEFENVKECKDMKEGKNIEECENMKECKEYEKMCQQSLIMVYALSCALFYEA